MKFKATGISDACTNFCFWSSWRIFYGILIIPIYKKGNDIQVVPVII